MKKLFVALLLCGMMLAADGMWLDVPFVKQDKDACGAASIAMVMQYWLKQQQRPAAADADPVEIQRTLYSREGHGIYASDLQHYFQDHGFQTFAFAGNWDNLNRQLSKGRPLIVALKIGGHGPEHYVVVVGLEGEKSAVLVNDPAQRKLLKQDWATFDKQWGAASHWTLLVVPQQ
jgi:ABC-type bacteriocin/lantibiotic exporter with double-glycine peptidase domain